MSIFVTRPIPQRGLDRLEASGVPVHVREEDSPISRDELLAGVRGRQALLCMLTDRVDAQVMEAGPLRVVSNLAVGVDNVDLVAARGRGVIVTNTPGVLTDATADLTLALLLALARRVVEGDRYVRQGRFDAWSPTLMVGGDLAGRSLGIIGAGRIGSAVARRARGFGMEILIAGRRDRPEVGRRLPLPELMARADFVSLHCPLTRDTHHLVDERMLKLMKPTAYLVNTARGPVIDEAALVRALSDGVIAGAALDVFEDEPVVHPGLLELPNVVLAPHVGSATRQTRDTMAVMAVQNLLAVLQGQEPAHRVV